MMGMCKKEIQDGGVKTIFKAAEIVKNLEIEIIKVSEDTKDSMARFNSNILVDGEFITSIVDYNKKPEIDKYFTIIPDNYLDLFRLV